MATSTDTTKEVNHFKQILGLLILYYNFTLILREITIQVGKGLKYVHWTFSTSDSLLLRENLLLIGPDLYPRVLYESFSPLLPTSQKFGKKLSQLIHFAFENRRILFRL